MPEDPTITESCVTPKSDIFQTKMDASSRPMLTKQPIEKLKRLSTDQEQIKNDACDYFAYLAAKVEIEEAPPSPSLSRNTDSLRSAQPMHSA